MTPTDVDVMILAAGLGTRLRPLTLDRAKPAVPFIGRPLITHVVRWLAKAGFTEAVVNTHYQPQSVRSALAGAPLGIRFSHESEILGTAGALGRARDQGLLSGHRPVLVVNGKLFTDLDPIRLLCAHARSGSAVTLLLAPNPAREAFTEVFTEEGAVTGFSPPRNPVSDAPLLFTGIQVVSPEVLAGLAPRFSDTVRDVFGPLIERRSVHAHVDGEGRWWEMSTPRRYLDLHHQATAEGLAPSVIVGPRADIHPSARVTRSVLWEGARVEAHAHVTDSVICRGVVVAEGETVEHAVVVDRQLVRDTSRFDVWGNRVRVPVPVAKCASRLT